MYRLWGVASVALEPSSSGSSTSSALTPWVSGHATCPLSPCTRLGRLRLGTLYEAWTPRVICWTQPARNFCAEALSRSRSRLGAIKASHTTIFWRARRPAAACCRSQSLLQVPNYQKSFQILLTYIRVDGLLGGLSGGILRFVLFFNWGQRFAFPPNHHFLSLRCGGLLHNFANFPGLSRLSIFLNRDRSVLIPILPLLNDLQFNFLLRFGLFPLLQ